MINFLNIKPQKFCALFMIIASGLLLQACGGQRDTPFDSGSSSSSSRGASVSMNQLTSGTQPVGSVDEIGAQIKITDKDQFDTYWAKYSGATHEVIDFDAGQVLLVDRGKKRACDEKLTLDSYAAYEGSVNSVLVVLNYKDVDSSSSSSSSISSSSSSSSSSCGNTIETQPYYFFYIQSRDELIVEENAD